MIEKVIYRNHLGEEFRFGENGAYLNAGGLRDFAWQVTKKNNRISTFERGVAQKRLPVVIIAPTEETAAKIKNDLFEIAEKDVLAMRYGQLIVGDQYMECFVTASTKTKYLTSERFMLAALTVQTDAPYWVKETQKSFYAKGKNSDYAFLDYNFDYPIDYLISAKNPRAIQNTGFTDSDFKLIIYGACQNPSVTIGGHLYQVNATVNSGERIVIDSAKKTIVLIDKNRKETNIFSKRNRDSYIFKKIPIGQVAISFDESFDCDLILTEKRSEPKWI